MSDNNVTNISDDKAIAVWNKVLTGALKLPGTKIDRNSFLTKELGKYYSGETISCVLENGLYASDIDKNILDKIAKSVINFHTNIATGISFGAGLPGGWWMAATIPADLAQFYAQIIIVAQKLAYIYGWDDFTSENVSDEFLNILTIFIGIMSGVTTAEKAIKVAAETFAKHIAKKLPQQALTKYTVYNVIKKVAAFLGVKITKETFAKNIAKAVPILGGFVSGTITLVTFKRMAERLRKYLASLPSTNESSTTSYLQR